MAASETFTCLSCQVGFKDCELQRQHHKSDWHWYNLKRKVVSLPPVSPEEFKAKVKEQKQEEADNLVVQEHYCNHCRKKFSSANSFNSHKRSKKHLQLIAESGETESVISTSNSLTEKERSRALSGEKESLSEASEMTESLSEASQMTEVDEEVLEDFEGIGINECLFCCHWSQSLEKNLKHMTKVHSFFIPDTEFCTDIAGFITYLGVKVGADYECLKCGTESREFRSLEAVQKHMIDRGHSIINTEGNAYLEYSEYYDFSTTNPDADMAEEGKEASEDHKLWVDDEMCLVLPTGARVGHRSMKIYYKQNLSIEDNTRRNKSAKIELLRGYRAIGWFNGEQGKLKLKNDKRRDLMRQKDRLRISVKANKFQTYFRPQVIF